MIICLIFFSQNCWNMFACLASDLSNLWWTRCKQIFQTKQAIYLGLNVWWAFAGGNPSFMTPAFFDWLTAFIQDHVVPIKKSHARISIKTRNSSKNTRYKRSCLMKGGICMFLNPGRVSKLLHRKKHISINSRLIQKRGSVVFRMAGLVGNIKALEVLETSGLESLTIWSMLLRPSTWCSQELLWFGKLYEPARLPLAIGTIQ